MKREDLLWTLAGVSFAHGYLASNVFSAIFGLGLATYTLKSRKEFKPELKVDVEFPEQAEEMKRVRVTLKIKNLKGDVKVRVKNIFPPHMRVLNGETFILKPGEERFVDLFLVPEKKGEYEVPLKLELSDLKELYFEELELGRYKLEVMPSVESIREAAKEDYNVKLSEVYKKSIFLGMERLELEGLREYLPGDDLRRIDWKASSRLGELIVRVFMKEWEGDVYLILDSTREMRKGIKRAKIDYASTLTLHLATVLLKKNYRVGLIIYTDREVKVVKPSKGREHLNKIRAAVKFKPEKGLISLKSSVALKFSEKGRKFIGKIFPRKRKGIGEALLNIKEPSYLIIISDLMSHTSLLYRLLLMLKKKHKSVILSPNPILFYGEDLNEETLKFLYEKYLEREKTVRKFNAVAPTIDLGPSDYLREIVRELR
ncbi:DUF58 domain-containing protein [Thermococcus argininiproducens]|uniref:DUF58 domain-containing protein n=1 Tax=Thermococcus argininiproducens TaxID=2866384 RepID=A0A9E7MAN1_9EURY|nr:DUF58 domain-containing protein [Thermococcus argininiproducens]USH00465.1 DUF58 domain-containing protein [Thermococcus argininiproducens]